MTSTQVVSDDVITRIYWDENIQGYVNTQESMISITFELLSSKSMNERVVYSLLALFGDIGGLLDFTMLIMTPLVGFIVGDRFTYMILKSLYMQNRHETDKVYSEEGFHKSVKNQTPQRLKQKQWLDET